MKLELVNVETCYDRASRRSYKSFFSAGSVNLPAEVERAIKDAAPKYGVTYPQMVLLVLCYYFGDGYDHFQCEHCELLGSDGVCRFPLVGEQTTMPLLDKGMVVVGHPMTDQGE